MQEVSNEVSRHHPKLAIGGSFRLTQMKFDTSAHRTISWISTSVTILSIIVRIPARADEATKQRFLREYPAASQELTQRFERVRCTVEQVLPDGKGKIVSQFRRNGSFEKVEIETHLVQKGQRADTSLVILKSPDVATTLYRANGDPFVDTFDQFVRRRPKAIYDEIRKTKSLASAWKSYEKRWSTSSWTERVGSSFRSQCGQYVYAPWGGDAEALARMMREPGFELIDASEVPDREGIVEVRFRRGRTKQVRETVVRLNTNNRWALVSWVSPIQNSAGNFGFEVRYGEPIGGIAWPERIEYVNGVSVTLKDWSFVPTSEDAFRPSHYGLPDSRWDWFDTRFLRIAFAVFALTVLMTCYVIIRAWRHRIRNRRDLRLVEPHSQGERP